MDGIDVPDFGEIDEIVKGINSQNHSFSDYVGMITDNGGTINLQDIFYGAADMVTGEFSQMRNFLLELICVVVVASIFVNISKIHNNRQVSETGFYITYMFMFMMLAVSFGSLQSITLKTMEQLLGFMQALVPTFFMTVSYVSGNVMTISFYQEALILITIVEAVLVKIFVPFINVYFVFSVVNPILGEDLFSNMLELMEKIIVWSLRTMFAVVIGVGAIQGMLSPLNGQFRMAGKIGGSISVVMQSVLSAGVIIKNAVGTAGLIVIIVICLYPVMKLIVYALLYQLGAAVSQPVSGDKRMPACMAATFKATKLLLMTLIMSAALFMVTIAVVTVATGRGY